MNVFQLVCLGAIFLISCAAAAAPSLAPTQKAVICGKRVTCQLVTIHHAGKSAIAEIVFGVKDKPDAAPDDGCRMDDSGEKKGGGSEYWLLDGAKPTNILSLCNDGYGAADVGEDTVTFSANRMVHDQEGGSSWRWSNEDTFSLVPFQMLSETSCSYHNIDTATGTSTAQDYITFRTAEVRKDPAAKWGDEDGIGCPDTKFNANTHLKPVPDSKFVSDYPVMMPGNNVTESTLQAVASGTTLGACAMTLSTDGASGFLTFGAAADTSHAAVMRAIAVNSKTLVLQIYDPLAAAAPAGKSWISGAHAEVWQTGSYDDSDGAPKRGAVGQIAIGLDGSVNMLGKAKAPKVSHWTAKDAQSRLVTVLALTFADEIGTTAISYSQAENGKQARLVSNVPMTRGVPKVIPSVLPMQNKCAVRGGRLELAGMMPVTDN